MECDGVKVQVSALLDASLDVEQVKAMEQHLESCSSCARFYQEELEVAHWLTEAGDFQLDPPPEIWQRINSQISAKPGKFRLPFLWPRFDFRYAAAGLAILALVSVALITLSTSPQENELLLAELESYELEVEGNPFLSRMSLTAPSLELPGQAEDNPFDRWRSIR